jgi:hypothetical protein
MMSKTLRLHDLQMAEGAAVLRDSAQAAVGCDAAAEELVSGGSCERPTMPCIRQKWAARLQANQAF